MRATWATAMETRTAIKASRAADRVGSGREDELTRFLFDGLDVKLLKTIDGVGENRVAVNGLVDASRMLWMSSKEYLIPAAAAAIVLGSRIHSSWAGQWRRTVPSSEAGTRSQSHAGRGL